MSAAQLFVRDSGGRGEAVLLVHALGLDHRMWDFLAAQLADRYRTLAVDLRGHGASPVPERPYTLALLAGDVRELLDRLQIARAHWIGLSLGGMAGQAFALAHGDRLGKLVLANTTSSYGPAGAASWQARMDAVESGGLASISGMVASRYFSEAFRAEHPETVAAVMQRFAATPRAGYLGCCEAIAALELTASLERVRAPTLVIAGAEDLGTPPAMSRAIAERIPGARMEIIAGASHLSALERPAQFAALARAFLDAA
jgi:3-oxoadipate enol-lactonase